MMIVALWKTILAALGLKKPAAPESATRCGSHVPDTVPDMSGTRKIVPEIVPDMSGTVSDVPDLEAVAKLYERDRKRRYRASRNGVPDMSGTCPGLSGTSSYKEREDLDSDKYKKIGAQKIAEDWQPDVKGRHLVQRYFGAAASTKIDIYRDHWLSRSDPQAFKTAPQWQAHFRWWVNTQHDKQLTLPLSAEATVIQGGRRVRAAAAPAGQPSLQDKQQSDHGHWIRQDSPQWMAWLAHRGGKSIPPDRDGGWFAPSEWPPQREASHG